MRWSAATSIRRAYRIAWLGDGDATDAELRARLALAIRVMDAGDYGPCRTWVCDQEHLPCWLETHRAYEPARPLWEAAAAHDPSITPAMRRGRGMREAG